MIRRQRKRLLGLFILSDIVGICVAFFYSYGFRFYGYVIPINPEKGIPPLKSYIFVFPLFLLVHLGIFYIQGFYKVRLKRTKVDDFFFITLNAVFTILIFFAFQNYLYTYSQGTAPLFRIDFKISHWFLAVYFIVVIFLISFLRNQIYFFMKRRYAKGLNLQKVLVLGAGDMGRTVAQKLCSYKDLGFVVHGFLDGLAGGGQLLDAGEGTLGPVGSAEPGAQDSRDRGSFAFDQAPGIDQLQGVEEMPAKRKGLALLRVDPQGVIELRDIHLGPPELCGPVTQHLLFQELLGFVLTV